MENRKTKSFFPFWLRPFPVPRSLFPALKQQLSRQGIKVAEHHQLITPKAFNDQELTTLRFPVPQKRAALVSRWLKAGGGLGGRAFGIEADALPKPRLVDLVAKSLAPYLRKTTPPRREEIKT